MSESRRIIEERSSSIPAWVIESGVESSFRQLHFAIAVISVRLPKDDDDGTPPKMVGVYANPTDLQCYRMIARVLETDEAHLRVKLNGMHSLEDSLAVSTAVAVLKQILWQQTGLFVQSLHLGNNSMRPIYEDGVEAKVGLGNDHEPYFYHEHLLCRGGDPQQAYLSQAAPDDVDDVSDMPVLGGPPLGTAYEAQQQKRGISPSHVCAVVRGMQHALRGALLSAQSGKNGEKADNNRSTAAELLRRAHCSVELV